MPALPLSRHGFTLLELIVVIAILAVLLTVALPSYRNYMVRVHRTEAVSALLELASCQERVFADHGHYDTTRCLPPDLDHYAIRLEPSGETASLAFTAWADPAGSQGDDPCGSLGLDQTGLRQVSANGMDAGNCWRAGRF